MATPHIRYGNILGYLSKSLILGSVFLCLMYTVPTKYYSIQIFIYGMTFTIETLLAVSDKPKFTGELLAELASTSMLIISIGVGVIIEPHDSWIFRIVLSNMILLYAFCSLFVTSTLYSNNGLKEYLTMYDNKTNFRLMVTYSNLAKLLVRNAKVYIALLAGLSMQQEDYLGELRRMLTFFGYFVFPVLVLAVLLSRDKHTFGEVVLLKTFMLVFLFRTVDPDYTHYTVLGAAIIHLKLFIKEVFFTDQVIPVTFPEQIT